MFSKHLWPSIKPSFSSFFNFFFVYSLLSLFFLCSYFFSSFLFLFNCWCQHFFFYKFSFTLLILLFSTFQICWFNIIISFSFFFHFFREGCFFSFLVSICFKLVIFYFVFMVFLLSYWVLWCLIKFKLNT